MCIPLLASATGVIGLAAAAGLAGAIVLFLRHQGQLDRLRRDLEDVRRLSKEGAADARARIEAAALTLSEVRAGVTPLLEAREALVGAVADVGDLKRQAAQAAPVVARLGDRIESITAEIAALQCRIGEVEQQGSAAEAGVESVREEWSRIQSMVDQSERRISAFAEDRTAETERLAELRSAVGTLRGTVEERIAVQEERLGKLETGPKAQLEAAATGGDIRAAVAAGPAAAPKESPADHGSAKPGKRPAGRPAAAPGDADDEAHGARWIFFVMAALLALALIAQYLRGQ